MELLANHPFAFGVLITFVVLGFAQIIGTIVVSVLPKQLQCPRCKVRVASVNVAKGPDLSLPQHRPSAEDRNHIGSHVCSVCWDEMSRMGFSACGNWGWGATVEYLKNNPTFIGMFISAGLLTVAILALVAELSTC